MPLPKVLQLARKTESTDSNALAIGYKAKASGSSAIDWMSGSSSQQKAIAIGEQADASGQYAYHWVPIQAKATNSLIPSTIGNAVTGSILNQYGRSPLCTAPGIPEKSR